MTRAQNRMLMLSMAWQRLKSDHYGYTQAEKNGAGQATMGRMKYWQVAMDNKTTTLKGHDMTGPQLTGFMREAGTDGFNNRTARKHLQ